MATIKHLVFAPGGWLLLMFALLPLLLLLLRSKSVLADDNDKSEEARKYLHKANQELQTNLNALINAQWDQSSNITKTNEKKLIEVNNAFDEFRKKQFNETKQYDYANLPPHDRRQFEKLAVIGTSGLNLEESLQLQEAQLQMENTYSVATINTIDGRNGLALEPDITKIMAESNNESLLRDVWIKWRAVTGAKMRDNYITYYKLGNKAAKINKLPGKEFHTFDDLWMFSWETDNLKQLVETLMNETLPLYRKIHAYVRFHLAQKYKEVMPPDGTIPAHLLGNMWAQHWSNILNTITALNPHQDVQPIDSKVNDNLKNWTVTKMFRLSEKFFTDLGMKNMTKTFWKKSILQKPTDRNITCHASAWDFYQGNDYRIKQCTETNFNDLITVHHEMGHIQYYMNYANQPVIYREGANPGFHEAIGDLIALSVSTPKHLVKVGLLPVENDEKILAKINLNYQLKMALEKIVFLPFAYVMDRWRWDVFGKPELEPQLNKHWWQLRLQYQGLSPPVKRSEADFDPGAKYHIPAGVEYVRYFVSHILQFQFFEHMCNFVDNVKELYQCDFDGNKQAGKSLINMLSKGSSDTWQNILRDFIGSEQMSLNSLNKYFQPLERYLDQFIARHNISVGWSVDVDQYYIGSNNSASSSTTTMPRIILIIIQFYLLIVLWMTLMA